MNTRALPEFRNRTEAWLKSPVLPPTRELAVLTTPLEVPSASWAVVGPGPVLKRTAVAAPALAVLPLTQPGLINASRLLEAE